MYVCERRAFLMKRFNCFDRFSCLTDTANTYHYFRDPEGQADQIYKLYELLGRLNAQVTNDRTRIGYFCLSRIDKYIHNYWWSYRDVAKPVKHYNRFNNLYWIESRDLKDLIGLVYRDPLHNWYLAMNTFKTKSRQEYRTTKDGRTYDNVNTILAFYLDFDVTKTFGSKQHPAYYMMKPFRDQLMDILLSCGLDNNMIVKTGHGYHASIILDHGIYSGSKWINNYWHEVQAHIMKLVDNKCKQVFNGKSPLDPSVSDIVRILRVPGSCNMKDYRKYQDIHGNWHIRRYPKPVIIERLNTVDRPDFWKLVNRFLGSRQSRLAKAKKAIQYKQKLQRKRKAKAKRKAKRSSRISRNRMNQTNRKLVDRYRKRHPGVANRSLDHLHRAFCSDIYKLVTEQTKQAERLERNHRPVPSRLVLNRDWKLFYYACNSVMVHSINYTRQAVKRLSRQFLKPSPVKLDTILNELGTHEKPGKIYKHTHHLRKDKKTGHFIGRAYVYRTSTITKKLGMTDKEQMGMTVLIKRPVAKKRQQMRYKERLKRQRMKRRPLVLKHKREREQAIVDNPRNIKIMRLHKSGLSQNKISKKVNISRVGVGKVIRRVVTINNHLRYKSKSLSSVNHVNSLNIDITYIDRKAVNDLKGQVEDTGRVIHVSNDPVYIQGLKLNRILRARRKTGDD